jgi:tetratricopeptide (TPR) repeat protein
MQLNSTKKVYCLMLLMSLISLSLISQENKYFKCSFTSLDIEVYCKNNSHEKTEQELIQTSKVKEQINKIIKPIGIPSNFILISCPNIDNAAAFISNDGLRYIIYDYNFINKIIQNGKDWYSLSILAHEIGHHLCGHTTLTSNDIALQRQKELEADEFSGFILQKLGATQSDALLAVYKNSNNSDDQHSTHPKLDLRISAIKKGYNKSINTESIKLSSSVSIENYLNIGLDYYRLKQNVIAIENYNNALKLDSNCSEAYNMLGIIYTDILDYDKGLAYLFKTIQLKKKDGYERKAYLHCAKIMQNKGNRYEALQYFNKAIELNVEPCIAYWRRSQYWYNESIPDYNNALTDIEKAITICKNIPDNQLLSDFYITRGFIYSRLKLSNLAILDFKKAISLSDINNEAYFRLAFEEYYQKHYDEAISYLNKGISLSTENTLLARYYSLLARCYEDIKNNNMAEYYFTKSIDNDPSDPYYYFNRAEYYTYTWDINNNKKALNDFNIAFSKVNVNFPTKKLAYYYFIRYLTYSNLEYYSEALSDINKSISLDPYDTDYLLAKGDILNNINDYNQSCLTYKYCCSIGGNVCCEKFRKFRCK